MTAHQISAHSRTAHWNDEQRADYFRYFAPARAFETATGLVGLSHDYKIPAGHSHESLDRMVKRFCVDESTPEEDQEFYQMGYRLLNLNPVLAAAIDASPSRYTARFLVNLVGGVASRFNIDDIQYFVDTWEHTKARLRHDTPQEELSARIALLGLPNLQWVLSLSTRTLVSSQLDERYGVNPFLRKAATDAATAFPARLPVEPLILSRLCRSMPGGYRM